ncbi:glycoside hydrolase superfamily [Phaeosphaeria sp. MPI-PUGE-AT-0046c]|nr:glycoside hydrolase superfamily [Phaeosphaeria sp. MPI-PUGE-AT-0046c]
MKGFFQKAKAELQSITGDTQAGSPGSHAARQESNQIQDPTPLDILRYRYHHGTNLGSVYVIERWLTPSRFPDGAEGSSELAAVKAWVNQIGITATQRKFEDYWASVLSDNDIRWLAEKAKCTTIRLPIGYFDLPGARFTRGTPFEPYTQVYSGAWHSIRTLIARLRMHSIGVLLDLHALPGGANDQEHSGTNSGRAELWSSSTNRALGAHCAEFIARDAQTGSDIVGIQLVNEAGWDSPGMYEWYDQCISAISAVDPSIPVIISDGWDLPRAINYTLKKNSVYSQHPTAPVIIDTHYYWAFTDGDKRKSPQEVTAEVPTKLRELDGNDGSVNDRGAAQVRAGGSFFWTMKMDWMPGGEWGFVAQSDARNIVPPKHAILSQQERKSALQKAIHERDGRLHAALDQHVSFWTRADPKGQYEHEKYEYGWKVGYQDALAFLEGRGTQGDRIGMLEVWILKRLKESGYRGGFTWLFEQGIRRGVQDFYAAAEL